jgi:hypothetical protein
MILQIFLNIPRMYGTTMVPFTVSWLVGFYFWLWLRTLFMNFSGYPFLINVTVKVASSFCKVSVHIVVSLLCRHLAISCLLLSGWSDVWCRYCPVSVFSVYTCLDDVVASVY